MTFHVQAQFLGLQQQPFSFITGDYQPIVDGYLHPARLLIFNSTLDEDVLISFSGTGDHLRIAANSYKVIDISANQTRDKAFVLKRLSKIFIKNTGTNPTTGFFWVEGMFGGRI